MIKHLKEHWIKCLYISLILAKLLKIINWSWSLILITPLLPFLIIAALSILFLGISSFLRIIIEHME